MKKGLLLFLLSIIPFVGYSQTPGTGWFEIEMEFGQYTFNDQTILITQDSDTLYYQEYGDGYNNTARYRYAVINADTGDIDIKLTSEYSGWYGIGTQSPAYIEMRNATQGIFYNPNLIAFGTFQGSFPNYTSDTTVNLLSQPPPIAGCMDSTSSSYNPQANIDNGQCTYPVSFAVDMNSYPDTFSQVYVSGQFNNWSGIWDSLSDPDGDNIWTGTIDVLNNPGWLWKYSVDNWADQELPADLLGGANPYATCFTYDPSGPWANRGLIVDGAPVVLDTNCWEKCLDCADIIGCTDSTSNEFNPWATISDGQCQGSNAPTLGPGETYIEVVFTPDNYGSESSWILYDDNGAIVNKTQGTYTGATPGVPISYYIPVDTNILVDIVISDSYGDGLCGTCFGGSVDGNLEVFDCSGNKLFSLSDNISNRNFGYQYTTPQFNTGSLCSSGPAPIAGCTDPFSLNYNPNATVGDGSCGVQRVVGCTDSTSFNYDANANTSEVMTGDYTLRIYDGQSNGWGGTWLGIKQGDWLSPQYQMGPNDGSSLTFDVPLNIYEPIELYLFTTPQSQNSIAQVAYTLYGPEGDTIVDVPYWGAQSLQFPIIQSPTAQPTFGDVCIPKVFGCTDTSAFNFDPLANTLDSSCIPVVVGCMNPLSFNYDSTANVSGTCIPIIVGCMDSTQYNYDSTANTAGTCIPFIYGCTDTSQFNYNPLANTSDGSCIPFIYGCTDPLAFNYDSTANVNDGSCIPTLYGCTDTAALNYNPLANTDNGSCIPKVYGCMDPGAFNFNAAANINQTSATDPTNPCIPKVFGCTDSTAVNYDPLANTDNGSCIPSVYGCIDPNAHNYDPNANVSDSSCVYDAGCITGPGNPYWLNDPCYAWVIDVDNYCCTHSWDPDCQAMYDYCATQSGTLDLEEFTFDHIVVFPNPTTGNLNIRTNLDITFSLFDFTGREVLKDSKVETIDISTLPNGVYFLSIRYHEKVFNKRIIKED